MRTRVITRITKSCFLLLVAFAAACGGARAWAASAEERFTEAQALFEAAQKRPAEEKADPVEAQRMFHEAAGRIINAEPRPPERTSIGRVLMFWHYDLSRWTKQIFMLVTYPLGCGLLFAGLMIRRRRVLLRLAVAFLVLGGLLGVSDVVTAIAPPAPWAVVLESGQGRSGNGPAYSVIVPSVRMGQEVRIIERRSDWARVEMPSGVRCWLPAETCEPV